MCSGEGMPEGKPDDRPIGGGDAKDQPMVEHVAQVEHPDTRTRVGYRRTLDNAGINITFFLSTFTSKTKKPDDIERLKLFTLQK